MPDSVYPVEQAVRAQKALRELAGLGPEMFKILLDERKTNPSAVDAFFATHPLAEDRITATLAQIRTYPPAALKGLNRDSRAFHAFKDRLASLPPSPAPKKQP